MEENEVKDDLITEEQTDDTEDESKSDSKKPLFVIIGVLILLAIGSFFIFGAPVPMDENEDLENAETQESMYDESTTDEDATYEQEYVLDEESETVDETDSISDVKVVEVEGGSYYYNPDVIEVKVGETVRIVLNSVDMMHDFVIDELNVQTDVVNSGDTGVVEFTVTEIGEYQFYCSVGDHRAQGMVGTLVVTE